MSLPQANSSRLNLRPVDGDPNMPRNYTSAQFYSPRDRSKAQLWADRLLRIRGSNKSISQFCRDENDFIQACYYWRKRMDADSTKLSHMTRQFGEHSGQRQNTSRQFIEHSGQRRNTTDEGISRRLPLNDATVAQRDSRTGLVQRESRTWFNEIEFPAWISESQETAWCVSRSRLAASGSNDSPNRRKPSWPCWIGWPANQHQAS